MNIELKPIDRTNYQDCINLRLQEEQINFVASNLFSLVQAAYEPDLYPLAVYKDGKMAGFILYDFDQEINGWSMSRFMIDKALQNQGIGKAALQKFTEYFRNKHGQLKLYTSAAVDNCTAIGLYEKFGFEKMEEFEYEYGGRVHREIRMILKA